MIALQCYVPGILFRKVWHLAELALCDSRFEILAPQNVFEILHPVDFVHTFLRCDQQPNMILLTRRFGGIQRLAGLRIHWRLI
jgi:hypothetical protein